MHLLLEEIEQRLLVLYRRLADGDDAPPAMRLRLEGLLEAAAMLELASPRELQRRIESAHRQVSGATLTDRLGEDWREFHPFPQIPAYMQRAPVTPSTGD